MTETPTMNYRQLKTLLNTRVNLWPRPFWVQGQRPTPMQWLVYRVNQTEGVVELLAPSGHRLNLADVIHHYQKAGNTLVLDAQLVIDGGDVHVEPRPWGATTQDLRFAEQPKWARMVSPDLAPQQMVAARLRMMNAVGDQVPPSPGQLGGSGGPSNNQIHVVLARIFPRPT